MNDQLTREQLLARGARAGAALAVLGSPLLRAGTPLAAPAPLVRRDVGGLGAAHPIMVSYRNAVAAMKALPTNDPRSWTYQAAIHGTLLSPAQTAWNTCEHGTLYFWSWHRMYLYYFERIVRSLSGNAGWALPYWNYGSASQRQLPVPFRDPASSLYTASRGAGWNSGAASLNASDVDHGPGFVPTDYALASGILEGTPHGAVHVRIGSWMGSVPTAAQDPVFWLHHCNLDRLWNLWLAQGGGRSNPLSDAAWRNTKFTFFDENRKQVTLTGCGVLRAALQLNYRYEGEPAQVNQYCLRIIIPWLYLERLLIRWPIPPVLLTARPSRARLDITRLRDQLARVAQSPDDTLLLRLEGLVAARQPGVIWQVYLGLPATARPDPKSPYFVGNVALFGRGVRGSHHFAPATFSFQVDRSIVASLRSSGNELPLTFVPTGPLVNGRPSTGKPAADVRVERVSFFVHTRRRR